MSWIIHDPDEFESVVEVGPSRRDPFGNEIGSVAYTQRRRDPEEVKRIKEERRRKEEDRILAEAEAIRARRGTPPERNSHESEERDLREEMMDCYQFGTVPERNSQPASDGVPKPEKWDDEDNEIVQFSWTGNRR